MIQIITVNISAFVPPNVLWAHLFVGCNVFVSEKPFGCM